MTSAVVFSPEAREQLAELYRYIADATGPEIAADFTRSIVDFCGGLGTFPLRGRRRDDLRTGLRTVGFRRRVLVAFIVLERTVTIVGIYYGGQDYEAALVDGPNG